MARERLYESNAERQAAYRARLAARHVLADNGGLLDRLAQLEAELAAAQRRADQAEQRAARAQQETADLRQRIQARAGSAAARPDLTTPGPRDRDQIRLVAALNRIGELEAVIAELQQQQASPTAAGPNRAARRAAGRDQRRRR